MTTPAVAMADRSWMSWTLVGIATIWIAVVAISMLAPDLVTGSQQEHFKLSAFLTWIWGLLATIGFLWSMSRLRGNAERRPIWTGLAIVVAVVWVVAIVVSVVMPTWETGSDPTIIPVWAITAPLGATLLTLLAGAVAGIFAQPPRP